MDNITISIAAPEDARGIREVNYASWLVTYPNAAAGITLEDIQDRLKDALTDEKIAKTAERMAQATENERYFVPKIDGRVVGYCHAIRHPDHNKLQAMYVLPEYTGKGIGTKMWDAVEKFFDRSKDTYVCVAIYNANAINFYKKLGFKETGKVFDDEKLRMKSGSIISQMEMVIKAK